MQAHFATGPIGYKLYLLLQEENIYRLDPYYILGKYGYEIDQVREISISKYSGQRKSTNEKGNIFSVDFTFTCFNTYCSEKLVYVEEQDIDNEVVDYETSKMNMAQDKRIVEEMKYSINDVAKSLEEKIQTLEQRLHDRIQMEKVLKGKSGFKEKTNNNILNLK